MPAAAASRRRRGRLLLIGGNEDMDERDMRILPRLVELAGGKKSRILVCAAASAEPERSLEAFRKDLEKLGVPEVFRSPLNSREEADSDELMQMLERSTAVLLTGGDQLRATSMMAGTRFGDRLKDRYQREGLLVAGTSAGAAAMSSTMIIRGIGDTVRRDAVELAPGLGFLRDITVDTHFDRGGRVHRLMTVLAQNPAILGMGIDEDTAVEIMPNRKLTVWGKGVVMIFDARAAHTNTAEVTGREAIALTDVRVQVLPEKYGIDLKTLQPIIPGAPRATAA
ncbi:MAG TPA: cyanophycinase [Gemmatimonadales bacterium]